MGYRGEQFIKIGNLTANSRNVNLRVKVLSVGEERTVTSRRDDALHRVAEALVGDETGTVLMTLWDDKIDLIREREGSTVVLKNCYVGVFRNSMRLNIGRYGSVEDSSEEIEEVNEENNISEKRVREYRRRRGYPRYGRRRG